ncbi:hypothetical protein BDN71DRAFT_1513096 [Pleurotus eryngii]|uniref:Uncharacterized protein n=1 Tax=Pleurotus eryngii TaxID=5323 RepID=A0A9P5ZHI1_PLEER|nr:hypothetical protein BDN71DRAFT_1513096 [Pleurotus eryngii]
MNNNKWQLTASQRKFLQDNIINYKANQVNKQLGDFWPHLFAQWFECWPATDTAPMASVKLKLKSWYNNNTRVTANACQVLNLNQPVKRTQRPALSQTFCTVWWSKKLPDGTILRDVIEKEWPEEWKTRPDYTPEAKVPRVPVTFINKVAKRIFKLQSPAIQEDIVDRHERLKAATEESDDEDEDEDEDVT